MKQGRRVGNLFTTASDMFPGTKLEAVVGIGGMARSAEGALFAVVAGRVLQHTHRYGLLFAVAASAYLIAITAVHILAPGLRTVQFDIPMSEN